jgi:hypothetical protein
MCPLPTIGFDTRAINQLEDGGEQAEHLMKALQSGFEVRLPGLSADEVLATPARKNPRREILLARCQRLLASGVCLWPPHEILRLMISEHFRNPAQFDWNLVDVRARIYELAIIRRDFTDELCLQQRQEQFKVEDGFRKMWAGLRPKLDEVLADEPSKRPTSYLESVFIASHDGGVLWGFGQILYAHVTASSLSEKEIHVFMDLCPPFRAACYALVMGWHDGALKPNFPDENQPAGRNDLLMATYLPYCGRFVADESAQASALRDIAAAASVQCDVLPYERLAASLGLVLSSVRNAA